MHQVTAHNADARAPIRSHAPIAGLRQFRRPGGHYATSQIAESDLQIGVVARLVVQEKCSRTAQRVVGVVVLRWRVELEIAGDLIQFAREARALGIDFILIGID